MADRAEHHHSDLDRNLVLGDIFAGSAVGIIILDRKFHVGWTNEAIAKAFGIPRQSLIGKDKRQLVREKLKYIFSDPEGFASRVLASYDSNDHVEEFECHVLPGEGREERWLQHWSQPITKGVYAGGRAEYYTDITERKHTADALRLSELRFKAVFNLQFQFMAILSPEGIVEEINDLPLRAAGITREQVVGRFFWQTPFWENLPESQALWPRRLAEAAQADKPMVSEDVYQTADGTVRIADAAVTAVKDSAGCVDFFIIQANDITERKRAEQQLRESESKHQFLNNFNEAIRSLADSKTIMATAAQQLGQHLQTSRCAYADVDPDGEHFTIQRDYTDGCESSAGNYKLSLFGSKAVQDMREGRSLILRNIDVELRTEDGADMFNAIGVKAIICCPLIKEGKLRAMMAVHQKTPRDWTEGEIKLMESVVERCWDTIERARAEQALRQSEEQNRLIMENVKDFAIFSIDLVGRATSWNPGAANIFGYAEEEVLGGDMAILFTPEDRAHGAPEQERITAREQGYARDERWHLRKNGERFFASGVVRPIRTASGTLQGYIKVARDITHRKRMEDALRDAHENLEKIVQQRTSELQTKIAELEAFSYSVSHDLRAPLRAMQGYSQFLLEDYGKFLDARGRDYMGRIVKASERLDRLVQDILTYSRVARAEIQNHPIDLEKLINEIVYGYPALHADNVSIEIEQPLYRVLGSESSLTQCISNLLGNAVKFVPNDRNPRIRIWTEERDGKVRVNFNDNGIGIAPEHQARIFRMFEKAEPHTAYEGTGIGLAIVSKAVERMNGAVGVESEPGQGSTFWIELDKPLESSKTRATLS